MKFTITGLKLAKYLVTVLGSNIKKVTWDGDPVELSFQGGSRGYLPEDINETEGNYDVLNSAVNVIEKVGPLDANAPYIVEFNKAPKPSEWANFMISCQGLGNEISISSLYGVPTGDAGTTIDDYYNNDYSTTTEMVPNYDGSTFTPIAPGPSTTSDWGLYTTLPNAGSATQLGTTIGCTALSGSGNLHWQLTSAPAGYYMVNVGVTVATDTTPTVSSTYSTSGSAVGQKYAITSDNRVVTGNSKYVKIHFATYCFQLTQAVSSATTLFSTQTTGYTDHYDAFGQWMHVRAMSQSEFESLRPTTH